MSDASLPPLPSLDPVVPTGPWADALRGAPAEERARWLRAADVGTRTSLDARRRGITVYRLLEDDLDPRVPETAPRFRTLVEKDGRRDAVVARLAARAAREGDGDVAALAEVVVGECAAEARDFAGAEARLIACLARHRGTGSDAERRACSSLAEVYRGQERAHEALVLARRAVALDADGRRPDFHAMATFRVAEALGVLEDDEAHAVAVAALAAALARLGERSALPLWRWLEAFRLQAAVRRGDVEAADRCAHRLVELVATPPAGTEAPSWVPRLRTHVDLAAGRLDDARRRLDALAALPDASSCGTLELEVAWARAAGRPDLARAHGRALLAGLERGDDPDVGPARTLTVARDLVALFGEAPPDDDALRRAYDVAGAAILQRIGELDRATRALPELSLVEADDRRSLEASRARFQVQQAALLDGVAPVLARRLAAGADGLPAFDRDGALVRVCAWCRRVAMADGSWLPVGHYLPHRCGPLHLSHGICPDCRASMELPRSPGSVRPGGG